MIPHHESAIAMAKLAQQKSTHLEIKTLAGNIITSQTTEIDKMKEWYKQWYGTDVPKLTNSSSMMSMMDSTESEASLNQATDFDKVFLEQMIPHHQMAVMMANMLEDGTRRQEMRTLAQDIVLAQSKEIDAMRNWQVQWGYVSGEQFTDGMMHAM